MIWQNIEWVDEGVDGLATADFVQVDLDFLVDFDTHESTEIPDLARTLFRLMLERYGGRAPRVAIAMTIPLFAFDDQDDLVFDLPLPAIGSEVDEVVAALSYPTSLRGISIPGYYISRVDPGMTIGASGRTTVTRLTTAEEFPRPVTVEHHRVERLDDADINSYLWFNAPIRSDPLVEFRDPANENIALGSERTR